MIRRYRRYVAVDGGRGAHLLAELAGLDPRLQPVPSPRHADLLIVVGPVDRKLVPAVVGVARALPQPARALIVDEHRGGPPTGEEARVEEFLLGARRIEADSGRRILESTMDGAAWPEMEVVGGPALEESKVPVPSSREMEMATEPAVLSLGPVQPFTAGPLRLLLVADGGQLLSAQVESGYAYRGIGRAMTHAPWRQAALLARRLDPLAPLAGQTAYVRAVESLQGQPSPELVERMRDAALALERAGNHLWWLARFAQLLESDRHAGPAREQAAVLSRLSGGLWETPPGEWIAPQGGVPPLGTQAVDELRWVVPQVARLRDRVRSDRLLALRTRGLGVLTLEQLRGAGVTGPAMRATEGGSGDVSGRVRARLEGAVADLREVAGIAALPTGAVEPHQQWAGPRGMARVAVEGPRGRMALGLVSDGGQGPAAVVWERPSAALLGLLPGLLAGQKLADAGAIVASLDLSMAEADG